MTPSRQTTPIVVVPLRISSFGFCVFGMFFLFLPKLFLIVCGMV